ncbi:MAG TPA: hypothetical protein VLJ19_03600 [Variovorax sp.]|nr:hypothetical protein [Variovorax sp.]
MLINGRRHCGNISFKLTWSPAPKEIPARACGCPFCTKHGGVWTSCKSGSLKVTVGDPSLEQARLSRRRKNWIANVEFERAGA